MRTLLALTALTVLASPVGAGAQYVLPAGSGTVKLTPSKAGTKRKPAAVAVRATIQTNVEQSRVSANEIVLLQPRQLVFDGRGLAARDYCSVERINADGPDSCSRRAEIGAATGNSTDAVLYPALTPVRFKVRVFLAAADRLAVHLASETRGINIQQAIHGRVIREGGAQRIAIEIPPELIQPIPGLYSGIKTVRIAIRRMWLGKGRRRHPLLGLTGCPAGGLPFTVRVNLVPNPAPPAAPSAEGGATAACRR